MGLRNAHSTISRRRFMLDLAQKYDVTVADLDRIGFDAVPCDCGLDGCYGWQVVYPDAWFGDAAPPVRGECLDGPTPPGFVRRALAALRDWLGLDEPWEPRGLRDS